MRGKLRLKISMEDITLANVKGERMEDFDPIMIGLKEKLKGKKR